MRNLLIVFFVICFLFLIIIFPFKTRLMGHVNLMEMKCYYSLKLWLIRLLNGKIVLEDGKIKMFNDNTFLSKTYKDEYVKIIGKEILSEIDVKKVEVFFTGGFKGNSFSSALVCGSMVSFIETLFGYLSLKFDNVKMYKDIETTFDENNLELTFDAVLSISLWRLITCLFSAGKIFKKVEEVKNEG